MGGVGVLWACQSAKSHCRKGENYLEERKKCIFTLYELSKGWWIQHPDLSILKSIRCYVPTVGIRGIRAGRGNILREYFRRGEKRFRRAKMLKT